MRSCQASANGQPLAVKTTTEAACSAGSSFTSPPSTAGSTNGGAGSPTASRAEVMGVPLRTSGGRWRRERSRLDLDPGLLLRRLEHRVGDPGGPQPVGEGREADG